MKASRLWWSILVGALLWVGGPWAVYGLAGLALSIRSARIVLRAGDNKVLISPTNPNAWQLEDIIDEIQN